MHDILKLQQKIVPELIEVLQKRYNILKNIYYNEPIGRRILANNLHLGERAIRTETEFLKKQNLISVSMPGMTVTSEGEEVLDKLKECVHEFKGLSEIEFSLERYFNIKKVIVVPGDIQNDATVVNEMGKTAANYLKDVIQDKDIIAVTGGSTIKVVIDNLPKINHYKDLLVLPARGGLGKSVELQANTLAAKLALKINASYKLLHIPENIRDQSLINNMLNEESIKDVVQSLHCTDILLYGIGRAEKMGRRRGLSSDEVETLTKKGAVGEAFGYYFDKQGKVIFSTPTIGFNKEDIKKIKTRIAVAGNKKKAEAIISVLLNNSENTVLITDEGTAQEVLRIINN